MPKFSHYPIYDGCEALKSFPHRGRPGRITGRRELVFPPYIAVYQVKEARRGGFSHLSRRSRQALRFALPVRSRTDLSSGLVNPRLADVRLKTDGTGDLPSQVSCDHEFNS